MRVDEWVMRDWHGYIIVNRIIILLTIIIGINVSDIW